MSNFRLNLARLLLLAVVTASAVTAQASDTENRLSQLERISSAHSQLLNEVQQQVSGNQADIDTLRGQIQETQYQLNQVIERQKQILLQLDALTSGNTPASNTTPGTNTSSANNAQSTVNPAPSQAGNSGKKTGDEKSDYQAAVELMRDKTRAKDAIAAFEAFSAKYPKSRLQPNAIYWIGQLHYSTGQKDNALYYFAKVAKDYPKSGKAPEALYKVGMIMQEKGNKTQASAVYGQVIHQYPDSASAKQAEKKLKSLR